jgi:superfamily I DNA and RNA helicase
VILIDEGQDFKPEFWFAIEMLKDQKEDAKLYIFQDCNQAIYSTVTELPISCEPLFLFDNCRNTKFIHDAAYRYYKGSEVDSPELEGKPIQLIDKSSLEQQAAEMDKMISKLVNTEKISSEDIAVIIIGSFYQAQELLSKTKNSHMWAFKEFSPKSKVLVETAKRFKGLESKLIFLWVIDEQKVDEKLLYVSISRARLRLWIVGNKPILDGLGL